MDKLSSKQLQNYAQSVVGVLSPMQLKTLLFVGLSSTVEYHQLVEMHHQLVQVIEAEKQRKSNTTGVHKAPIAINPIMKGASLTKSIPFDLISNNICHYLKMSSITNLAQCDRQLAIICHTPTSICNLMHRYDPYRYNPRDTESYGLIDGQYYKMRQWNASNMHRFKNVKQLAISLEFFDRHASMFTNMFQKLNHLSIVGAHELDDDVDHFSYYNIPALSLLKSICFVNIYGFPALLHILATPIARLNSISFVDTHLQILRFENSHFEPTDHTECNGATRAFRDLDRIKASLINLKGLVYSKHVDIDNSSNQFFHLSSTIVHNISSFKRLKSIHAHCLNAPQFLSFLNPNNTNELNQIRELCISVSIHQRTGSPLNCLQQTSLPKLRKLCIVVSGDSGSPSNSFAQAITSVLQKQGKLRVFQLVIVMNEPESKVEDTDDRFCERKIAVLNRFLKELLKLWSIARNNIDPDDEYYSQPLEFRLHLKACHRNRQPRCRLDDVPRHSSHSEQFGNTIQKLFVNYLMTYPSGKIQFKFSWNANTDKHDLYESIHDRYIRGLDRVFRFDIKYEGSIANSNHKDLYTDMDFKQHAISASNKGIEHARTN
eukprot:128456_1